MDVSQLSQSFWFSNYYPLCRTYMIASISKCSGPWIYVNECYLWSFIQFAIEYMVAYSRNSLQLPSQYSAGIPTGTCIDFYVGQCCGKIKVNVVEVGEFS